MMAGMHRRAVLLAACLLAAAPAAAEVPPDPLEGVNRRIHAFNGLVRSHVLGPVAEFYVGHAPLAVRSGVANALANLGEPVTALSALLAGDLEVARNAALRFGINTTIGLGGVRDSAAERGHAPRAFTLADAACRWGLPSGPFLVLPLAGPSSLRDAVALATSGVALSQLLGADAVSAWAGGVSFVTYAEAHRGLMAAEAGALDPYAMLRSAHLQRRAAACQQDAATDEE
jgi:phospholipid-binding lipoprotein MlaA